LVNGSNILFNHYGWLLLAIKGTAFGVAMVQPYWLIVA
jgi:hypothetical protein